MSEEAVIKYINAPLTEETVKDLHAGDVVRISGYIYTARDAAHKRLYEALERGEKLALLGRNGAGKTTAVNLLLGFLLPQSAVPAPPPAAVWTNTLRL